MGSCYFFKRVGTPIIQGQQPLPGIQAEDVNLVLTWSASPSPIKATEGLGSSSPQTYWLTVQRDRRNTLASVCQKNNLIKLESKLDSHVASQIFVEHKHKFTYCEVPKVGCSNWKRTIFILQEGLNVEASEIQHDHIHRTSLIKRLSAYPPGEQEEFLNSYTNVMFTRHPLERLVSAYRDKLLHFEPYYSATVANRIKAMFRKSKNSTEKLRWERKRSRNSCEVKCCFPSSLCEGIRDPTVD
uniref:Carbohydrate sulfotransferase n=1 Tax=Coturnix japonica TaxID=93934 RepID=A0A8C2TTS5_COTJA